MNWLLLKNSLLVGGLTTLLAASFGFLAALWLAGLEKRWRHRLLAVAVMARQSGRVSRLTRSEW